MKPAPFQYHAPRSVAETIDSLASYDGDAKLLAGGQSLLPLLSLRFSAPSAIVDLNGVDSLAYHRIESQDLVVGALCRHRDIELDSELRRRCPAIADAVSTIGHVSIRNRGTVVGSIVHADPSAEWPALALLFDASVHVVGLNTTRSIPAENFFEGFLTTDLAPDEVVTEIRFQLPPTSAGSAFAELARRHGDFAMVGVGAVLDVSPEETVRSARIALIGVGEKAIRVREAEAFLTGREPDEAAFAEVAALVAESVDPPSDIHATSSYRRRLADVLTRKVLTTANQRA